MGKIGKYIRQKLLYLPRIELPPPATSAALMYAREATEGERSKTLEGN